MDREMFAVQLTERLNKLRSEGVLCDVLIKCQSQAFGAHRAVLAASCEYFKVLFTTSMQDQENNLVNLEVPSSIANELLSFLYTGKIDLCDDNSKELLVAADYLMIEELKLKCEEYIATHSLSIDTSLVIYHIALDYNCEKLTSCAENLVMKNFEYMKEGEEFMQLSFRHVERIISSDDLVVDEEQNVYEAIVSWVTYNPQERIALFEKLFKHVRLCSISVDIVTSTIAKNPLVRENKFCMSLVLRRIQLTLLDHDRCEQVSTCHPRKCLQVKDKAIIYLGGISNGRTSNETLAYIPYLDTMTQLKDMSTGRDEHAVVVSNDVLYVIGGVQCPNSIECYNPTSNTWSRMAALPERAIASSAVYIDGKIFIIGGSDGFECVSTVQCYHVETQSVEILPSLTFARKAANAVQLDGSIYIIGGCTYNNDSLNTTERMKLGNGWKWERKASLLHSRKYACASVLSSGKILVAGGFQDVSPAALKACEIYNPLSDEWHDICGLVAPRGAATLACSGDRVFILGGKSDRIITDTMEYYDEKQNKWSMLETRLPSPCAWLQCGILTLQRHNK